MTLFLCTLLDSAHNSRHVQDRLVQDELGVGVGGAAGASPTSAIVRMPSLFSSPSCRSLGSSGDENDDGFFDCEEGRGDSDQLLPRDAVASSPLLKYRDLLYRGSR